MQGKAGKAFYNNWHLWVNTRIYVTNYLTFWGSSNLLNSFPLNVKLDFLFPSSCNKEALLNPSVWQNSLLVSLLLLPMQCLYPLCCFFPKGHNKQLLEELELLPNTARHKELYCWHGNPNIPCQWCPCKHSLIYHGILPRKTLEKSHICYCERPGSEKHAQNARFSSVSLSCLWYSII